MKILSFPYRYDLYIFSKYTKNKKKTPTVQQVFHIQPICVEYMVNKKDKLGDKSINLQ